MKKFLLPAILTALAATTGFAAPKPLLKITVEQEKNTDRDVKQRGKITTDNRGNSYVSPDEIEKSEKLVLAIKIQSMTPGELKGLRVKYAIFSRDRENRAVNIGGEGEKTVDIKPPATAVVKTDAVTFTTKETKFTQGEVDPRNNRTSGQRYYGCAVVVYQENDKIASYYTPDSLAVEAPKMGY